MGRKSRLSGVSYLIVFEVFEWDSGYIYVDFLKGEVKQGVSGLRGNFLGSTRDLRGKGKVWRGFMAEGKSSIGLGSFREGETEEGGERQRQGDKKVQYVY